MDETQHASSYNTVDIIKLSLGLVILMFFILFGDERDSVSDHTVDLSFQ